MTRDKYVREAFYKNFIQNKPKNEPVVLYGIGRDTEIILKEYPNYPVVGLLDGTFDSGEIFGKRIAKLEEVKDLALSIIIIAREGIQKIIYDRIQSYCMENHITVYTLEGRILSGKKKIIKSKNDYFLKSKQDLKKRINSAEKICFEIFGTLLISKRTLILNNTEEMELFVNNLTVRESMMEMLCYALNDNKTIYLLSNFQLSKSLIVTILDKFNIYNYKTILYEKDLVDLLLESSSFLFVGDESQNVNKIYMKSASVFLIKSPINMFNISTFNSVLQSGKNNTENLELDLFAAKLYNDPFSLYQSCGRPGLKSMYDYGYLFLAPILVEFVLWMISSVQKEEMDCILFISRDGYLIKQLYDRIKNDYETCYNNLLPKSYYLLTSRKFCLASSLESEEDINYAVSIPFSGSVRDLLEQRFFLEGKGINGNNIDKDAVEYIMSYKDNILEKSRQLRFNYRTYLNRLNIINDKNIAIFDFVSTGTCQMCLEKILGKKLRGYYFSRELDEYKRKKELNVNSFFESEINKKNELRRNYLWLEHMIKEPVASLSCMDSRGMPVYLKEYNSKKQVHEVHTVQNAVLDYLEDFLKLNDGRLRYESGIGDLLLQLADDEYLDILIEERSLNTVRDEFHNREMYITL